MNIPVLYPIVHVVAGAESHLRDELDRREMVSEILDSMHDNLRENRLRARRIPTLHAITYAVNDDAVLSQGTYKRTFLPEGVHKVTRDILANIPQPYKPFVEMKENDLVCANPAGQFNHALEDFLRRHAAQQVVVTGTLTSVVHELKAISKAKAKAVIPLDLVGDENSVGRFGTKINTLWTERHAEHAMFYGRIDRSAVEFTSYRDLVFRPDGGLDAKPFNKTLG